MNSKYKQKMKFALLSLVIWSFILIGKPAKAAEEELPLGFEVEAVIPNTQIDKEKNIFI